MVRAQVKTDEQIDRERQGGARPDDERLRSSFDNVAGASLRSNSEVFLKLAREHLGQHNQNAASALMQREKAIEALVAPIRDALNKTEQQIQQHREGARRDVRQPEELDRIGGGRAAGAAERDTLAGQRAAPAGSARPVGRAHAAPACGARGHGRALRLRRAGARAHRRRRVAPGHGRAHARGPRSRGRREDAARCVSGSGRGDQRRSARHSAAPACRRPSPSACGSSAPRTTGTSSRRARTS